MKNWRRLAVDWTSVFVAGYRHLPRATPEILTPAFLNYVGHCPLARSWNSLRDFHGMRTRARNEPETIHSTLRFARQRDDEGLVNDGSETARQNCICGKFHRFRPLYFAEPC